MSNDSLDIALLLNDTRIPGWLYDALDHCLSQTDAEVSLLVLNDGDPGGTGRRFLGDIYTDGLWGVVMFFQRLAAIIDKPDYWEYKDVRTINRVANARTVLCDPISHGPYRVEFPDEIVNQVAVEADVAFLNGYGILTGDILSAPTYGVLGVHHGDLREYRGQPAGLWEFLNSEDTVGVTIQRLSETLDGGKIVSIARIDVSNAYTWQEVRKRMYEATEPLMTDAILTLNNNPSELRSPDRLGDLNRSPGTKKTIQYLVKNSVRRIQSYIQ